MKCSHYSPPVSLLFPFSRFRMSALDGRTEYLTLRELQEPHRTYRSHGLRRSVAGGVAAGKRYAAVGDPVKCFSVANITFRNVLLSCARARACEDDS